MGYSLRSDRYRYVEWRSLEGRSVIGRELYDYEADPLETFNRAGDPYLKPLLWRMRRQLRDRNPDPPAPAS
jgi:hypothetical protein